jgi:curved DNA-binding protein CbpA
MRTVARTYYAVLGVPENADLDEIRSAYRTLARRYHPDAGAGSSSDEFRRIVEAYETLHDAARRRVYDRTLRERAPAVPVSVVGANSRSREPEPLRAPGRSPYVRFRPAQGRDANQLLDELFDSFEPEFLLSRFFRW